MSAQKKSPQSYHGLYAESPSADKKAVEALTRKLIGLLASDPRMARKAAQIIELWMRQKSK